MDRPKFKILRSPSLKRKQRSVPIAERVKLERVLGLTVANNAALSVDKNTGTVAYPAGCVVVLYNPKKGKQTHIFNACKKTITCLAFSGDGKHLVTGESGHQPAVRVWSLEENVQVAEFLGHKFGVGCVAFSPNLKYIVSIGTQHDMMVNVWNWKTNIKVASNKVASKVTGVAFSEDGSMFVTVGNRHVKFWYLDASKSKIKTETLPLQGRNGILGEHQNNFFCGVSCGKGQLANSVYAITESGLLCEFDQKRLLVKWVSLRTDRSNAMCLGEEHIFIGCSSGLVRIFSAKTLNFIASLPRPHHLGVDVSLGLPQSNVMSPDNSRYPDTIAVKYDDLSNRLTCIYNDHSLYVWDVTDVHKVAKTRSFLFHSGAVWGVDVYPEIGDTARVLPPGSFATCSSDNTIRIWNCSPNMSTDTTYKRNIYCNELLKVLYIDPDLNNLLDIAYNPAGKTDKTDTTFQEKNGIRSVRFSPDGKHMAAGDRAGNLRVHDLMTMQQITTVEAHDSEVLCLEYSQPSTGVNLLATASRDRLLHVFDADHSYGLVQTLDDHSAAITAIKFVQSDGQLLMMSCGADKSLLFRNAQMDHDFRFVLTRHLVSRTTLYDMEIDTTGKFVATACQDRNIRIYNTRTGKQKKCYSGSCGTEGTLLRVELDPSGYYAATSCSDKNLSIYDFFAGELVASMFGHSEISPGLKFLNDLKHVVSVSVDGCVFVWRLPIEFTECMMNRIGQEVTSEEIENNNQPDRRETFVVPKPVTGEFPDANRNFPPLPLLDNQTSPLSSGDSSPGQFYRFSVGQLPAWAKPRVQPGSYEKPTAAASASNTAMPKGKWARDVEGDPSAIKPFFTNLLNESNRGFDLPASFAPQSKVSIIDDDEFNQDDEVEDEFSPVKSRQITSNPFRIGQKIEREISDNSSNSVEDEDEAETNETPYYMPSSDVDLESTTAGSSFTVQENDLKNLKDSLGPGEDEEQEQIKSRPSTPTESSKESDVTSPDEEKVAKDTFEKLYQCNETFEETLKKLEDEITARYDGQTSIRPHRHSISSRFFDNSQVNLTPSQQSRPAVVLPVSLQKEFTVKFADDGKKNSPDNVRSKDTSSGSAGGARRFGKSFGGETKSSKADSKFDSVSSFATLPKSRSKASRQSTDAVMSSAGVLQKATQPGSSSIPNIPSEADANSQQKRKPVNRVQSYRMQTESSLAKHNAGETGQGQGQGKVNSRRSAPFPQNSKFQSTPDLYDNANTADDEQRNDTKPADDIRIVKEKILAITKGRQFSPVPEVENESRARDVVVSFADTGHLDDSSGLTSGSHRNGNHGVMQPPSTFDVPTSVHDAFLVKASKHRQTRGSEMSLSQAKNILMGRDQGHLDPDSSSDFPAKDNHDVIPMDIPVRDVGSSSVRPSTTTAKSVANVGRLSVGSIVKSTLTMDSSKTPAAEEFSEMPSSPRIIKVGRCASPIRPFSAGPSDDKSGYGPRRILPADPKMSSSSAKESTRDRTKSLGSDQTLLCLRPETLNSAQDESPSYSKTPQSVSYMHTKSSGVNLGRSSPFKMLLTSEGDSKSAWVKKAQQFHEHWEQKQQKRVGGVAGADVTTKENPFACGSVDEIEETRAVETTRNNKVTSSADAELTNEQFEGSNSRMLPESRSFSPFFGRRSMSSSSDAPGNITSERFNLGVGGSASVSENLAGSGGFEVSSTKHNRLSDLIPSEGEPDMLTTSTRYDSRKSSLQIPVNEISNISSGEVKDVPSFARHHLAVADETEDRCARVASELTEAVSKATQMFTQLSSDSSVHDSSTSSHDRALKLLRETICEAKDQLSKTLDGNVAPSSIDQNLVSDKRVLAMLENYSEKLYDMFKKKLESD